MLDHQPHDLRRLAGADRPLQRPAALVMAGGQMLEQQRHRLRRAPAERVRQGVRARHGGAGVEEEPQAAGVGRLDRVVDRLVVVRIGAGGQQQRGHARLVRAPGRAVERALGTALRLGVARVRVGPGGEQRLGAGDQAVGPLAAEERRVRDVEQREPGARAERSPHQLRVAGERGPHARRVAEHERGVEREAAAPGAPRRAPGRARAARPSPPRPAGARAPRVRRPRPRHGGRARASSAGPARARRPAGRR